MIILKCYDCDKSFLNGVDLSYHIELEHGQIPTINEKKCPQCTNERIEFIAKGFEGGKENHNIYYCPSCQKALKIEFN